MMSFLWPHRFVQLPSCGLRFQTRVLILHDPVLHPVLHVGHRILGQLLVGRQKCACSSFIGSHDTSHHVNADFQHKQYAASRVLYQGYICWCVSPCKSVLLCGPCMQTDAAMLQSTAVLSNSSNV